MDGGDDASSLRDCAASVTPLRAPLPVRGSWRQFPIASKSFLVVGILFGLRNAVDAFLCFECVGLQKFGRREVKCMERP